jgi:hypothetical protein
MKNFQSISLEMPASKTEVSLASSACQIYRYVHNHFIYQVYCYVYSDTFIAKTSDVPLSVAP